MADLVSGHLSQTYPVKTPISGFKFIVSMFKDDINDFLTLAKMLLHQFPPFANRNKLQKVIEIKITSSGIQEHSVCLSGIGSS